MKYTIYTITCKNNGKIYYGRSQEFEKRTRSHLNMLRSNTHYNLYMQEDFNKYGESSFVFEIIHEYDNIQKSIEIEQQYIDENIGIGYNIGGSINGGDLFTTNPRKEEIRELRRKLATGKNNPMYGKPKSQKMIDAVKKANSKSVSIEGVVYSSISEASKKLGIGGTTISYRINAQTDRFKDWVYVDNKCATTIESVI